MLTEAPDPAAAEDPRPRCGAPVVVGIGDRVANVNAVTWAAREARLRRVPLVLVRAHPRAEARTREPEAGSVDRIEPRRAARILVHSVADRLRQEDADLIVDVQVEPGDPAGLLLARAESSELLVLGAARRGLASRLLLGSVSSVVAARAAVPVVIVRDDIVGPTAGGDVVVGVNPEVAADPVLRFAFDHAAVHGSAVRAVLCGPSRGLTGCRPVPESLARWLSETLARWCAQYPAVPVTPTVRSDELAPTLVAEAMDAALVVVGRDRVAHRGTPSLGAVSHAVVRYATRPVAVVPAVSYDLV